MGNILLGALILFSSIAHAEFIDGYVSKIHTTNHGVNFTISCGPTKLGTFEELKFMGTEMLAKLDQIQCSVKRIWNPFHHCRSSAISAPSCKNGKTRTLSLFSGHANYQGIIQLLTTSYLSQNPAAFDVGKIGESDTQISYDLYQVGLGVPKLDL
ncbi:MAG: hypothetical protein ABIQ95_11625 [Bdellovibrionia bacterium]